MKKLARIFSLAVLITPMAFATEYTQIQPENSRIAFNYQQMGVSMAGAFQRMSAPILSLDPSKPEAARAVFEVDISSIDTGSADNDAEAVGKAWLDSQTFKTARFEMTRLTALGGNRYDVTGTLTIKGHSQEMTTPATLTENGKTAVLEGNFSLDRTQYAIGEGEWAAADIVAPNVTVRFSVGVLASQ